MCYTYVIQQLFRSQQDLSFNSFHAKPVYFNKLPLQSRILALLKPQPAPKRHEKSNVTENPYEYPQSTTHLSRAVFIFSILSLRVEALMEPLEANFSSNSQAENISLDFLTSRYLTKLLQISTAGRRSDVPRRWMRRCPRDHSSGSSWPPCCRA